MQGLGGNLGTIAPFINFTKIEEASKTTVYLTFLKQNNLSRMGSLSNRDLLSNGSREDKKSEVSMVAGMVFPEASPLFHIPSSLSIHIPDVSRGT